MHSMTKDAASLMTMLQILITRALWSGPLGPMRCPKYPFRLELGKYKAQRQSHN